MLCRLIDRVEVTGVEFGNWTDIGYPWDLLDATERVLSTLERDVSGVVDRNAVLRGAVVVEAGASVDSGVVIEGPVLVRSGATVGPNALVRGPAVIGANASVGHAVEIKNSLLMRSANVNHLSYVGDSIVGPGANLGAGTMTANLRHDGSPVMAGDGGEPTGRRKFGTVIGPGAKTGVNTSVQPGVVLAADSWTAPGDVVDTDRDR